MWIAVGGIERDCTIDEREARVADIDADNH